MLAATVIGLFATISAIVVLSLKLASALRSLGDLKGGLAAAEGELDATKAVLAATQTESTQRADAYADLLKRSTELEKRLRGTIRKLQDSLVAMQSREGLAQKLDELGRK